MSTVTAAVQLIASASELFSAAELPSAAGDTIRHNGFNTRTLLNATSTPPVSEVYAEQLTGPQSLDLTALVRTVRPNLNATGLKLGVLMVNNLSTTDDVVISDPVSNPYSINDGDDITIPPSSKALLLFSEQLADVAAGAKAVTITAAAGEDFQLLMLFG